MIKEFSNKTIDNLKFYVYVYSDPDTRKPFYIGKGKGNRVFSHLSAQGEDAKINKINELKSNGKEPVIEILVHGVSEDAALRVEAAVIDLIGLENLTNKCRGYESVTYGKIDVDKLEARYSCEELKREDITDSLMMIKINNTYRNGMSLFEIYDITRGCWKVNLKNAKKVQFALAVYEGIILEVFQIKEWFPAGETLFFDQRIKGSDGRYEFVGTVAPENIQKKYKNKSISSLFRSGNQVPFLYFMR